MKNRDATNLFQSSRLGSGYALVMGFAVAGMAAIAVSSTFVDKRFEVMHRANYRQIAMGALEAVLTRRESMIVRLAQVGDPEDFARLHANYGEEQMSHCRVRWKIEPAIIREAMQVKIDAYGNPETDSNGDLIHDQDGFRRFVQNPGSFSLFSSDSEKFEEWQNSVQSSLQNDFVYVYRVSGESRYLNDEPWSFKDAKAVVQAVRYVAIAKQPVFRYVIFYAQEGPKGDLEFTHVPEMDIKGSVQCNGSIYMGGSPLVNNWNALTAPTTPGPYDQQPTKLGFDKDGKPVRVNGVYGIFRLDKKTLFSQINDYPMAGVDPGVPGTPSSIYDTDALTTFPGEEGGIHALYPKPFPVPDLFDATWGGRIINPNRIQNDSNLQTIGGIRQINGIEIRGKEEGGLQPNDSRQDNWKVNSMQGAPVGFQGFARTRATGGGVLKLPAQLGNRAFEVQRLLYRELDGDPSTDEHEFAQPLFIDASGLTTTAIPNLADPIIEAPGRYVGYAFGEGGELFFRRRSENHYGTSTWYDATKPDTADPAKQHTVYNGWDVVTKSGNPAPRSADATYGLIIRERPQPDNSYFSIEASIGQDSFYYMPYAYGKHTRAPIWPLWEMDVVATRNAAAHNVLSAGITDGHTKYIDSYSDYYHIDKSSEFHSYSDGGRLQLRAAQWPGPDGDGQFWEKKTSFATRHGSNNTASNFRRDGWFDAFGDYQHYPEYYRENWRFFHMQRPQRLADSDGLGLTVEFFPNVTLEGQPVAREIGYSQYLKSYGSGPAHPSLPNDKFSLRAQGFLKAPVTGNYRFWGYSDDGIRIWVNGVAVVDRWKNQGAANRRNKDVLLQEGEYYPVLIEYYEGSGGAVCQFKWRTPEMSSSAIELVPQSALSPIDHSAFKLADVDAVQMRIKSVEMPSGSAEERMGQKVGLMIRSLGEQAPAYDVPPGMEGSIVEPLTGPIVIEAEAASRTSTAGTAGDMLDVDWEVYVDASASGSRYVMVPNNDDADNGLGVGPRLSYPISFANTGTYYVHLRMAADTVLPGSSDSVWVGFDSQYFVNPTMTFGAGSFDHTVIPNGSPNTNWSWQKSHQAIGRIKVEVGTPGVHTLHILVREDGTKLDKIILTQDPGYASPSGVGPDPTAGGWGEPGALRQNYGAEQACVSHIADGRDAYLALLHNPDRGVFMQYRGAKAKSVALPQKTYFVGSKDDTPVVNPENGETGVWPGSLTRTVKLRPEKRSEGTDGNVSVVSNGSNIRYKRQLLEPVKKIKAITLGDGTTFDIHYYQGVIQRQTYKRAEKKQELRSYETWRWTLMDRDPNQVFLTQAAMGTRQLSDRDKNIRFFESTTGEDYIWNTTTNHRWNIQTNYIEHTFEKKSGEYKTYGPTVWSSVVDKGTADTIWFFDENGIHNPNGGGGYSREDLRYKPYKMVGGTKYTYSSWSDFTDDFGSATIQGNPGWPAGANSTAAPNPVPPTPVLDNNWDEWMTAAGLAPTEPVTFYLRRDRKIHCDLNPYITKAGQWNQTPIDQTVPWPTWATVAPPKTHAIRPDLWFADNPTNQALHSGTGSYSPAAGYRGVVPVMSPETERRALAPWFDDIREWEVGKPLASGMEGDVWLRMERVDADNFRLLYYLGHNQAIDFEPDDWRPMTDTDGNELLYNTSVLGEWVLIGPCLQSGHRFRPTDMKIQDLSLEYKAGVDATIADPKNVLDKTDWEAVDDKGATFTSMYLASQYQVFWGPYDITEDFFSYRDLHGDLIANESWIYNPREFQSQSRWWACGGEKEDRDNDGTAEDGFLYPTSRQTRTARELLAKQTLLDINMRALQNYLINRNLFEATADMMGGGYNGDAQDDSNEAKTNKLKERFNGLFYFARTNRYPWNPNLDTTNQDGHNPWTWPLTMPNQSLTTDSLTHDVNDIADEENPNLQAQMYQELLYGNGFAYTPGNAGRSRIVDINSHPKNMINGDTSSVNIPNRSVKSDKYRNLQPYPLANAPAHRWQEFHHGVRINNASAIDWGLDVTESGGDPNSTPEFGASKSIFVSPNQFMIQGDLNTKTYTAAVAGSDQAGKFTPVAVVGDAIYMLSNQWDDYIWQSPGIIASKTNGVTGGGSLYIPWHTGLPDASSTTYNCSIITHNQPTTREGVRNGEAASIITVMLLLEDWLWAGPDNLTKQDMNFSGSLVVMDSRRYSNAYLLDTTKQYGNSPWGPMGWHQYKGYHEDKLASSAYASDGVLVWGDGTVNSAATLGGVYRAGNRNFSFNEDLLSAAGTPPFTPFGVTATGTGAWVDFIK